MYILIPSLEPGWTNSGAFMSSDSQNHSQLMGLKSECSGATFKLGTC